jgi:hypothetical protein
VPSSLYLKEEIKIENDFLFAAELRPRFYLICEEGGFLLSGPFMKSLVKTFDLLMHIRMQ